MENKGLNDALSVICQESQWRMNSVSALYNLQYNPIKFKQYASKIKHDLVSSVTSSSLVNYSVKMEQISALKQLVDDPDALVVTIGINQTDDRSEPKILYRTVLMCWGVKCSVPEAIHLPYLLEKGEQKIGNSVKTTLSTIFDCNIFPLSFTPYQLLAMAIDFVETFATSEKRVGFTYTIPCATHKQKLTIDFDIDDIYQISTRVKEESQAHSELVQLTYKMLQNQIFHTFTLDVATLNLVDITFPKAQIKINGTVKMRTPQIVKRVFNMLNEISKQNHLIS